MLSNVLGALDKTSSSFSAHGKIGNFIIIIIIIMVDECARSGEMCIFRADSFTSHAQYYQIECKGKKVKQRIAVSGNHLTTTGNHMPYGITQCYLPPGSGAFPALPQPKLVLDITTQDGCKAELT